MPIRYNKLGETVEYQSMSPQIRKIKIMMALGVGIWISTLVDDMQMEIIPSML